MRLSLRSLLICMTLASVVAAMIANRLHVRHRAIAIIEQHNVDISWDTDNGWLTIAMSAVAPRGCAQSITRLNINGEPLNGELMWAVAQLREVTEVTVRNTVVAEAECELLSRLPKLHTVSCHGSTIEPGAVRALCRSRSMRSLCLSFTNATNDDCNHIATSIALTDVWLSSTRVTDVGLRSLAQSPYLTTVGISPEYITPAGLEDLLAQHPTLTVQCYGDDVFSDEWWASIKRRYPQCRINR